MASTLHDSSLMLLETEVVVVGAGAAGLAAARLLTKHGLNCVVLEGGDTIGGRIQTLRVPEWHLPIELGAEFVHGRPAPTVAFGDLELELVPEHRVLADPTPRPLRDTWPRFADAMRGACDSPARESVSEYLARRALSSEDDQLVRLLVEGYHAAPLDDVSARAIAQDAAAAGDFRQFRPVEGYGALLRLLEHGIESSRCHILLRARVRRLEWGGGAVTVTAGSADDPAGLRVTARRAVVTASVAVLRTPANDGGIDFRPVPEAFASALPGLGMGRVMRLVLRFEHAPWPETTGGAIPTFLQVKDAPFETFWRQVRDGQAQITAWVGGPKAQELSRFDEPTRVDLALRSLAQATGRDFLSIKGELLGAHSRDFNEDPLIRGAYGYVRPGLRDPARALREPCDDTLYFAGEALDLRYPGTVAGALGSGEHTARKLLSTWRA